MSEYIKVSDIMKIYKSLYNGYGTTASFNVPVFIDLLTTVAVEFPDVSAKKSQWISVKTALPERGRDVLVTDGIHYMVTWCEDTDDGVKWVDNFYTYVNVRFKEVTHWMPIPEVVSVHEPDEIEETYMDDVGGIHSPCDCYNPYGYFCGDCGKLSCKDCKYRDLQPDKENNDD